MSDFREIVIVGGGPAGAYCALEMAKNGLKPVILDHSHPREKPCGGAIAPFVLYKFPFLEKLRSKGFTFGNFKVISSNNEEILTKGLENGFCISRQRLDKEILDMAIQEGSLLLKEKVLNVQNDGHLWKVKTDKSVLSTRNLIGADGVNSVVRRAILGPISRDNLALGFGYITSKLEKSDATIKFLAEVPSYVWVFPGRGYGNVGVGGALRFDSLLKNLLDTFIKSSLPNVEITSKYSGLLPSATTPEFFKQLCAGKNWALIGDAAGHVDPISGEGILYALWGGKLVARAVLNNNLRSFDKAWRREYGVYLEDRRKNKDAFYDPSKSSLTLFAGSSGKV